MKLVISSLLLALLASVSVSAQTTAAPATSAAPEAVTPAQEEHMAAPAAGEGSMAHETKHKKAHKAAAHHAKKKHHKKKKHHSAN